MHIEFTAGRRSLVYAMVAVAACLLWPRLSLGQEVTTILSGPATATAGSNACIWVHVLNHSTGAVTWAFPSQYSGRITAGGKTFDTTLPAGIPITQNEVTIPAGGFVRKDYALTVPQTITGQTVLEVPAAWANRLVFDVVQPPAEPAKLASSPPPSGFSQFLREGLYRDQSYSPVEFFKQHFFGYEPFYFIAGPEAPEGKFQISLRYQILNREGRLAERVPFMKGLNFAYTQTSLWDLGQESSPFLDTSYKPELFYLWESVDGGRWGDWVRLDLQAGIQHESNGNPEINSRLLDIGERVSYYTENGSAVRLKTSRSLNLLYLRPTIVLGRTNSLQLGLSPRVWTYVGDLSDNPALPDYRGYADLRATLGWANGLQLSALGRLGDDANRGSLQLDLTYPLMKLLWGSFSVYFQAQYFTGYGESLLLYKQRSDELRLGFSIYR